MIAIRLGESLFSQFKDKLDESYKFEVSRMESVFELVKTRGTRLLIDQQLRSKVETYSPRNAHAIFDDFVEDFDYFAKNCKAKAGLLSGKVGNAAGRNRVIARAKELNKLLRDKAVKLASLNSYMPVVQLPDGRELAVIAGQLATIDQYLAEFATIDKSNEHLVEGVLASVTQTLTAVSESLKKAVRL